MREKKQNSNSDNNSDNTTSTSDLSEQAINIPAKPVLQRQVATLQDTTNSLRNLLEPMHKKNAQRITELQEQLRRPNI